MKRISVMLVEDHTVVRECICAMLKLEPDLDVVGEAFNGRVAVRLAAELQPDVILMDIAMPKLNGLEATRQLVKVLPASRVIIISANCDDSSVKGAVDAGAVGFLPKQDCAHNIGEAIRQVSRGGIYYSPSIARRFVRLNPQSRGRSGKLERRAVALTSREMEVLQLIAEGYTNKETAWDLAISIKTVEKHREQLMRKLDIHDIAGLTRHAIAAGIIECNVRAIRPHSSVA
jgi:DNA-binding NarL/FixJ family response regulator